MPPRAPSDPANYPPRIPGSKRPNQEWRKPLKEARRKERKREARAAALAVAAGETPNAEPAVTASEAGGGDPVGV